MPETAAQRGGGCVKDKWSAYWITGLSVLGIIGAVYLYLDRPHQKLDISVQTAPEITEMTAAETASTSVSNTKASVVQTVTTVSVTSAAETEPPERNLNLADAEDLKRVSGIGDALAAAIISQRTALGGFTDRMQLCEINGVGEKLMRSIMAEFEIPDETEKPETAEPPEQVDSEPEQPDMTKLPAEDSEYYIIGIYDANTVTREELLMLPDMTEETADAILKMREQLKGYHGIYEMSLAEGVSGEYFENVLKQYLYVEGDPYSVAGKSDQ